MANPYTANFPYNKTFTISSNPGANYQVKLVDVSGNSLVTYQTGMNSVNDMRFCDELDNELSYWIESSSGSIETHDFSAVVWVKIVSGTAENVIFNWGNASATDGASGADTFELFEDFIGTSLPSQWTQINYLGTFSDGQWHVGTGSGYTTIRSNVTFSDITIHCKIQSQTRFTAIGIGAADFTGNGSSLGLCYATDYESALYTGAAVSSHWVPGRCMTTSSTNGDIITNPPTGWYTEEFSVPNGAKLKHRRDGGSWETSTNYNGVVSGYLVLDHYRSTGTMDMDYIFVTKYISTEPTFEEAIAPITANFSADATSGPVPLTVTFTDSSDPTPTSWAWKFGDGETSEVQNPVHIYAAPGTYKVILTATNEGGSDTETKIDYIEVTPSASTVFVYLKETEMDHKIGSTQKHGFKISAWNGSGFKSTCTAPVISCSVNGFDETTETWAISAFSATMNRFTLEVVDPGTWVAGDNIHIQIVCDEGFGDLFLNIVPNYASLATYTNVSDSEASIIAAIDIDAALTLYGVATSAEIGGIGTGGNEHVITGYSLNASTKTITITEVGYTTLSIEQIKFIYNITQGCEIYDRETPRKRMGGTAGIDITINGADITFIEDATMTNNDKLLIVVNV